MSSPSFEDAYAAMKEAQGKFDLARLAAEPDLRDSHMRMAFNSIYQAARLANMLYTNIRRKGAVAEGGLLTWAKSEFDDFTSTLYMQYFSRGNYPKDDFEGEFTRWSDRAKEYLNRLNSEMKLEQNVTPVRDWTDSRPRGGELLQNKDTCETCGILYFVPTMKADRGLIGLNFQDYEGLLAFGIKDEEVILTIKKAKFGTEYTNQAPEYKTQTGLYTITMEGMPKPQLDLGIKDVEELRKRGFKDLEEIALRIEKLPYRVPWKPSIEEFKLDL